MGLSSPSYDIIETSDFEKIRHLLHSSTPKSLTILDQDQTLIDPKWPGAARGGPHEKLADFLKKTDNDVQKYLNTEKILKVFRTHRGAKLVHKEWPDVVEETAGIKYVITQFPIDDITPKLRCDELAQCGLKGLTQHFRGKIEFSIPKSPEEGLIEDAFFKEGVFLTGKNSKGALITWILKSIPKEEWPDQCVCIDDKKGHVEDMCQVLDRHKIPSKGVIYRGVDVMDKPLFNDAVIVLQLWHLLRFNEWMSDEKAFLFENWLREHEPSSSTLGEWFKYGAKGPWYTQGQEMELFTWLKNDTALRQIYEDYQKMKEAAMRIEEKKV